MALIHLLKYTIIICLGIACLSCKEKYHTVSPIQEIENAKSFLYDNNIPQAEKIINSIDTTDFDKYQDASYQIALSFLNFQKGNRAHAIKNLESGLLYFDQSRYDEEKAEINLLHGFLLETALLKTEAAKSYLKGLQYFSSNKNNEKYFRCLLGVLRTTADSKSFMADAESYVKLYPTEKNKLLYLSTKSTIETDKKDKLKLLIESISCHNEVYNKRNLVRLYSNIAKTYQSINISDSAKFYIELCEKEIDSGFIEKSSLSHYYLIRAYIENKNNQHQRAIKTLNMVISESQNSPGLLAYAYRMRSQIYKSLNNLICVNEDLEKYIKFLNQEYDQNKINQVGLIKIQLQLKQKELQLLKTRKKWILTSLILSLVILSSWFVFKIVLKKNINKRNELERINTISSTRLKENIKTDMGQIESKKEHQEQVEIYGEQLKISGLTKQEFNAIFNIQYPLFREKLSMSNLNLTNSDMKYCDCILAELTIYQTTVILGVSESAVKKARRKLKNTFNCASTEELCVKLKKINETVLV